MSPWTMIPSIVATSRVRVLATPEARTATRTTTTLRGPAVVAAPAASHEPNVERAVTNATGRPTARTRRVLAGRDMRRSVHRDF